MSAKELTARPLNTNPSFIKGELVEIKKNETDGRLSFTYTVKNQQGT